MHDVELIILVGTGLLLLLAVFIAFMTMSYQSRRLEQQQQLKDLEESYQKEILNAQLEMQEQTFLAISQEIHDNVGQILSLARLNMSLMEAKVLPEARQKLTDSKELIDQAIEDLRSLSKRLNSNYASQQSISALLAFQLLLMERTGVLQTSLKISGEEVGIEPDKKLIIFRIVQESLNNVLRHATASRVDVQLFFSKDRMTLKVTDDGIGFTAVEKSGGGALSPGTGTYNMQYRAKLIGATLELVGKPANGTDVILQLPLT
ncbi:sensor histidine kinase [Rufibacter sp. LB8]|uniref:sensor histidine kinase n=1 Tax=Rufibacter sp. LB8 TaxID=2777781 RepID=UPI00178C306C|nr:ATP-binding protein [Rufibacter sp. LB8]